MRRRRRKPGLAPVANMRITENPTLWGLVVREHGELVEFVSYRQARVRYATQLQERQTSA